MFSSLIRRNKLTGWFVLLLSNAVGLPSLPAPQAPCTPCTLPITSTTSSLPTLPPLKFLPPPVVDALITSICRQIGPNGRQGSNQAQSRTRTKWEARQQQATNSPNLSNFEPHSFFLTLAPMPIRGLDSENLFPQNVLSLSSLNFLVARLKNVYCMQLGA